MENVALKYIGGRALAKNYYNRQAYVFKKDNNFICVVPQGLADTLLKGGQYISVAMPQEEKMNNFPIEITKDNLFQCACGFKSKSEFGLLVHKKKHERRGEKI